MPRKQELYKCTVPVGGYYFGTNVDNVRFTHQVEQQLNQNTNTVCVLCSIICLSDAVHCPLINLENFKYGESSASFHNFLVLKCLILGLVLVFRRQLAQYNLYFRTNASSFRFRHAWRANAAQERE